MRSHKKEMHLQKIHHTCKLKHKEITHAKNNITASRNTKIILGRMIWVGWGLAIQLVSISGKLLAYVSEINNTINRHKRHMNLALN